MRNTINHRALPQCFFYKDNKISENLDDARKINEQVEASRISGTDNRNINVCVRLVSYMRH